MLVNERSHALITEGSFEVSHNPWILSSFSNIRWQLLLKKIDKKQASYRGFEACLSSTCQWMDEVGCVNMWNLNLIGSLKASTIFDEFLAPCPCNMLHNDDNAKPLWMLFTATSTEFSTKKNQMSHLMAKCHSARFMNSDNGKARRLRREKNTENA